ncbi:D,D-dipeptide ABC transporter permease, partial [Mesorhizobium sp. M7D.F.Ca.US.004.03.1.1]
MSAVATKPRSAAVPEWLTAPLAIGTVVILFWLFMTAFANLVVQFDPLEMVARRLQPPSWAHWLGTDALGRDVLARTLHGAAHSLPIAVLVVVSAVVIGSLLGAISGFVGGLTGAALMRL